MSEAKAIEVDEAADLVLNGYAVTRDGENFKVVNLRTGKAAYIMSSGELSETNMDDVESEIAMRIVDGFFVALAKMVPQSASLKSSHDVVESCLRLGESIGQEQNPNRAANITIACLAEHSQL